MPLIEESLNQFDGYIKGAQPQALIKFLRMTKNRQQSLSQEFKLISIDNPEVSAQIEQLLTNLCIPKDEWGRYFNNPLTIYNFLHKLSREGCLQVTYILEEIEKQAQISKSALLFGALFLGVFVAWAYLIILPLTTDLLTLIVGFVASSSGLPIIGLFITSVVSAYGLYQAFSNQKQPVFDRIRDALFIMAMGATNIIGYGILLGTGMIMTPVVAGFFVLSSSLDVVKEIFCMIQEAIQYKQYRSDFNHPDSLSVHRSVHRHEVRYQKHLNAAVINLISALAVVGIMAIWCFLPGALIVTVASIAALAVVYGVKYCALKHNDTTMRNRLQENLTHVLKEHDISTFVKENSSTLEMLPLLNKATEDHQQAAYNSSHGGRGISFFQQSERSYNPISTEKMSPPVSPH